MTNISSTAPEKNKRLLLWGRQTREIFLRLYQATMITVRRDFADFQFLPGQLWGPIVVILGVTIVYSLLRLPIQYVYTESILFLVIAVGFGLLSRTTGIIFIGMHVFLDMLGSARELDLEGLIGYSISYVLLWALIVAFPKIQRSAYLTVAPKQSEFTPRNMAAAVVSALVAATLIYMWTVATPYLIRPTFDGSPPVVVIATLQKSGLLLAAIGLVFAFLRAFAFHRQDWIQLEQNFFNPLQRHPSRHPWIKRVVLYAIAIVVLSGLITSAVDVLILAGALLGGDLIVLIVNRLTTYRNFLLKIPYYLRFLAAFAGTFAVAHFITTEFYQPMIGSEFFPLVISIAFGFVIFSILLGVDTAGHSTQKSLDRNEKIASILVCAFLLGAVSENAYAHDCSGLTDCAKSAWAWLTATLAAIAAFIWSWIKGVTMPSFWGIDNPELNIPAQKGWVLVLQKKKMDEAFERGDFAEISRIRRMSIGEFINEFGEEKPED